MFKTIAAIKNIFVSNNVYLTGLVTLKQSLIYRLNSGGPNNEPWGTPQQKC